MEDDKQGNALEDSSSEDDVLDVAYRRCAGEYGNQAHRGREGCAVKVCSMRIVCSWQEERALAV